MQRKKKRRAILPIIIIGGAMFVLVSAIGTATWYYWFFTIAYENRVFPPVVMQGIPFGGKTKEDVVSYWLTRNKAFDDIEIQLVFETHSATLSSHVLAPGYDATLSATQAYLVGRSPYYLSNMNDRLLKKRVDLTPVFLWNKDYVHSAIKTLAEKINIPAQDPLFHFSGGKVLAFQPSKDGRAVNEQKLFSLVENSMASISGGYEKTLTIPIPVEVTRPTSQMTDVNTFGIKELIGRGYSQFTGSIPGRIHNVALAAAKLNGILIKPGETFSFNKTYFGPNK